MSGDDLRDVFARLIAHESAECCSGYAERLEDDDPVDTDVMIDGRVNFAEVADAVLALIDARIGARRRVLSAQHRARMRELTGKTPFGSGAGYLASEDADEVDLFDESVEEWLARLNEILRRTKGELEALDRAADGSMFGLYRVRMTARGAGPAESTDREMRAVPRVGDYVNAASGELVVDEVHWNFDPAIPCDVVLFMVSLQGRR